MAVQRRMTARVVVQLGEHAAVAADVDPVLADRDHPEQVEQRGDFASAASGQAPGRRRTDCPGGSDGRAARGARSACPQPPGRGVAIERREMARLTPLRERDRLHVVAVARVHADRRAQLVGAAAHRHDEVVAAGPVQPLDEHRLARLGAVQCLLEVRVPASPYWSRPLAPRPSRALGWAASRRRRTPGIAAALAVVGRRCSSGSQAAMGFPLQWGRYAGHVGRLRSRRIRDVLVGDASGPAAAAGVGVGVRRGWRRRRRGWPRGCST